MAAMVTVPGASGTTVPNSYNTPYNLEVAQQISNLLATADADGLLFIHNSDEAQQPVPSGDVGMITVTGPGAEIVDLPPGYSVTVIDSSVSGSVTVSGGSSLFAGNQDVTYYGATAPNTVMIAAGDGDNLFSMPDGASYEIAFGDGDDTVFANGSGTVTGGSGNNIVFADSQGGENDINSYGNADTIVAGQGVVTVNSYGANPLVVGGSGPLVYLGGASGNPTVTGGTGQETLYAGAGQDLHYMDGSNTTTDANILVAGGGNETLNAGSAEHGVKLAAGMGSVEMIGSQGDDIFFGGAGAATMIGNGGLDGFIFGNTPGHTGGTDIITDFNSSDNFVVSGYGANAAQNALNTATISGGNTAVRLSDNTTITFLGVTNPSSINNQSF
jgi:Ca2+-binding RTX toxin-like protein